ncbi:hypothetical protein CBF31_04375 [Vagococcus fessus]|uniref:Endolytic murein transglycosylase n=2 Tax=Vagococcus fessus TaxID=120370 RepID=A0A430ADL1_9ENTE|nr:hypothetical protein CBF31_04375 [Vagococcus fessus]
MSQHRYDQPTVSEEVKDEDIEIDENELEVDKTEENTLVLSDLIEEAVENTEAFDTKLEAETTSPVTVAVEESDNNTEKPEVVCIDEKVSIPFSEHIEPNEYVIPPSSNFKNVDEVLGEYENQDFSKDSSEIGQDDLVLESQKRKEAREKESSLVKKIVFMVISALVVILMVFGLVFYRYWQAGLKPLDKDNKELVQVEIPIGTSNKGIGSILEKKKVIKSGLVFNYFVKTNNLTDFKGGYYQMSPDMELTEIAELLKQGGSDEAENLADARITVPEGDSLYQIAEKFEEKTKIPKEDFIKVAKDEKLFEKLYKKYPDLLESVKKSKDVRYRLEGYLFPATYNYYQENGIEDLITQMVGKTASVMATKKAKQEESHLSTQELLTLASLVEKEGVVESDRRKIAKVFLNRIEEGMPLQSDISIIYAMDVHKVHLSNKDTQVDSPYNLYVNKGFGPGPFNNPSEQAIDAVLNPDDNKDLYFLADITTHKVYFAETYEEHLKLKEEYIDKKK